MSQTYRIKKSDELHYLPHSHMHPSNTYFHFSFASYYDPNNVNFGLLRVLNDDTIMANKGFDKHSHKDMQIVSYIIDGHLTHWDNVTNSEETIGRGHVQAISAGSGVWHSEKNTQDHPCRLLQIWLLPPYAGGEVRYTNQKFAASERENQLLQIIGNPSNKDQVPLYIHSDVNIYVSEITQKDTEVAFELQQGREAYINCIEGELLIEGYGTLKQRDSLLISQPDMLRFTLGESTQQSNKQSGDNGHFIIIEMGKDS